MDIIIGLKCQNKQKGETNENMYQWGGVNKNPSCKFNGGVDCSIKDRKCDKCGWNPEVYERRKELNRKYPSRVKIHN